MKKTILQFQKFISEVGMKLDIKSDHETLVPISLVEGFGRGLTDFVPMVALLGTSHHIWCG